MNKKGLIPAEALVEPLAGDKLSGEMEGDKTEGLGVSGYRFFCLPFGLSSYSLGFGVTVRISCR